jgi:hypothetical protein
MESKISTGDHSGPKKDHIIPWDSIFGSFFISWKDEKDDGEIKSKYIIQIGIIDKCHLKEPESKELIDGKEDREKREKNEDQRPERTVLDSLDF